MMKSVRATLQAWVVRRGKAVRMAGVSLGLALFLGGCATGAYPVDFFPEMHYQQSFRAQEPPRIEAPRGSVPTDSSARAGQVVRMDLPVDLGSALNMRSPLNRTQQNLDEGQRLYNVNCGPCHGPQGKGDGALEPYFKAVGPQVPVDLTGPRGMAWNEGQLYSIVTNGSPPGYFENPGARMPAFGQLLTPDERWLIVMAVQKIQGR